MRLQRCIDGHQNDAGASQSKLQEHPLGAIRGPHRGAIAFAQSRVNQGARHDVGAAVQVGEGPADPRSNQRLPRRQVAGQGAEQCFDGQVAIRHRPVSYSKTAAPTRLLVYDPLVNRRYVAPVFLGAFLLFALQPMAGKRILPRFGGGPAVWTTCMLLFQALLLAGYAYAHLIATRFSPRAQRRLYIAALLLSAPFLAIILDPQKWAAPAWTGDPAMEILWLLATVVGFPYLMLASTGPLLQSWARNDSSSVYRLYAVSNAASFLALLSYPVAIEPWISAQHQFWLWCAGYVVYLAVTLWCATQSIGDSPPPVAVASRATGREFLYWLALAACGSAMLLAV